MSDRASCRAFTIRQARRDEGSALAEFQLRMAAETEDLALDPATVGAGVDAVFADPAKGTYYVAVQAGRLVGCLLALPEWSDWRNGAVLWICSVYVIPEARGRGVYRRLYAHLQDRVRSRPGLRGLRLYVDKRNVDAQGVYDKLGMSREHYHLYEWLEDG